MITAKIFLFALSGLIIGSFLNVVIYRLPRGESLVTPRSHCPQCGHLLRLWELIPVVSYIVLGKKCSICKSSIPWRYPAIELLTGGIFVLAGFVLSSQPAGILIIDLVFISLLIVLTFIDIETFRLPDILVILVAAAGLVKILAGGNPSLFAGLVGSIAAGGVFFLVAYFYPEGMGWGDVKLVAALGLYLGYPAVFYAIFLASLLGVFFGGINLTIRRKSLKEPIPFGPFLAAGAVLVLLGQEYFRAFIGFTG